MTYASEMMINGSDGLNGKLQERRFADKGGL